MKTTGKVLLWFVGGLGLLLVGVGLMAYFALQTQPGQAFLLRTALGQTDRFIEGDVRVGGIRSDGLLRGFTLHAVSIHDSRGRLFLEADSLRLGYSARAILSRDIVLSPAEVWSPTVVIETLHGDEVSNVARVFRIAPPDTVASPDPRDEDTEAGTGIQLVLDGTRIHDGEFVLRLPIEGPPNERIVTEEIPGFEGIHQQLRFSEIDARLASTTILDPDEPGEHFEFERLSLTGRVFEEPLRVEDFQGEVRRSGSRLDAVADRLELPGSVLEGRIALDWSDPETGPTLDLLLDAEPIEFEDLRWLEPRLPEGSGRLTLAAEGPVSEGSWRVTDADVRSGNSRVRGRLGLELGPVLRFVETDLVADPVELVLLEPWVEDELPVGGRVRGPIRLTGTLTELGVDTRLEYDDLETDLPSSTIEARGTLLLSGGEVGVRAMSLNADPLDYRTLEAFFPEFPLRGTGSFTAEAEGRLSEGVRLTATLRHRSEIGQESRIFSSGTVRYVDEVLRLALDGDFDPVDLGGIAWALDQEIPLQGPLTGYYRVNGPLADLEVGGRLETEGGSLTFDARGDALDPGRGYRISASSTGLDLNAFLDDLPVPTVVRGRADIDGRGLDLETVEGTARIHLEDTRTGHVLIDVAEIDLEALDGRLLVRQFQVESPMGRAEGQGDLALREPIGTGEVNVSWEIPELSEVRPLIMGDTIIRIDTLSAIEMETLAFDGVDLDTLAAANGDLLDGRASGEFLLEGAVRALDVHGFADVEEFVLGSARIDRGRVDMVARVDDFVLTRAEGTLDMADLGWQEWQFEHAIAEGRWEAGAGDVNLDMLREPGQSYRAEAGFVQDSLGVEVDLRTLTLDMDPVVWSLTRPSRLHLARTRFEVEEFEIRRPDQAALASGGEEESVRIWLDGVLDLDGPSDIRIETERLDLNRLGDLARMDTPPSGFADLTLTIRGMPDAPEMDGDLFLRDFEFQGAGVDRVEGTLSYRDRTATASLDVEHEGQRLLVASGSYPVDLAFHEVEDRFPNRQVDVVLEVDELPAATVLTFVGGIEDVGGTLDGRIELQGEPQNLSPSGALQLSNGSLWIPEIGLRPEQIEATFSLDTDGIVTVSGRARSRGSAEVTGTLDLNDITDPGFDLRIVASEFQATDRRDLDARIGGEVLLTGRFRQPRITGNVRVEQGNIFLEEIARTAEVVDLTDPAFFDVVDMSLVEDRPAVEAAQNPFLNNLRVDVDLSIQRDFWLRSREMNVEITGDLIVTFDRPAREILLVGTLEATRGNYVAFGRQFQVQEGVVEFVGTPGINPTLDIRAVHRLRREGQEPLNIIAAVEGPLLSLRIGLESEAQPPIGESDLISYLLFGRPAFALGSSEASALQGAAGAGVSVGIGTLAGQLSAVVAQQIGLDYFAITQSQDGLGSAAFGGFGGAFSDTQIEVGQYLAQDLFLAMVLRPLSGVGGGQIPGARMEWRFTDTWTVEAFIEDRFGREGVYSFGNTGLQLNRIFGLELYREWGY